MAWSADAGRASGPQQAASQPSWLSKSSTGQRIALPADRQTLTIGRDPDSDINLDDPDVSRRHAVLLRTGSSWVIQDTTSTNGTFVNGSRITAPTTLREGDTLRMGNGSFTFHGENATGGNQFENSARASQVRNPAKQPKALRNSIIAGLILYVVGLVANALNTVFSKLENPWLSWLLPTALGGAVVVIGAIVNHVSSSGNRAEPTADGGQPGPGQPAMLRARTAPVAGVLAILLVLGVGALGLTVGIRYAVGYFTGAETANAERFAGQKQGSRGGVSLTVTRIYETDHFTRVEVTALSQSSIPQSLPLGQFCSLSGPDQTLESDPLRSQWTTVLARGVRQHGTITFLGHLSPDAQSATLSFSFGPDQPQVKGIKLQPRR